ncbi:MAG TPA: hypothetical protein VGB24_16830 [Longimicrobium sp.]|jgi:hypothetical protein|uniref:hypothetical protein n=1 Tax=Longimicrobium sp. TaxID=2029185 RepID=UPI002EDBAB84
MLKISHLRAAVALLWGLATADATAAEAQTLARQVAANRDGTVLIHFDAAPGACGDGRAVIGRRLAGGGVALFVPNLTHLPHDAEAACTPGPVRVALGMAGGRVASVRATAGPAPGAAAVAVSPADASAFLLDVAMRSDGQVARGALVPVFLLDGEPVWRGLLRVARSARAQEARSMAAKELGRRAAATIRGAERGDRADTELSRKNGGEEEWLAIATRDGNPARRRAALQLLGKEGTPRALDLFESILSRAR